MNSLVMDLVGKTKKSGSEKKAAQKATIAGSESQDKGWRNQWMTENSNEPADINGDTKPSLMSCCLLMWPQTPKVVSILLRTLVCLIIGPMWLFALKLLLARGREYHGHLTLITLDAHKTTYTQNHLIVKSPKYEVLKGKFWSHVTISPLGPQVGQTFLS